MWPVSSWASTHSRISSTGRLQSAANWSMFAGTTSSVSSLRGIGRSYWPNVRAAMRPTIEPTAMPIIDGAIIWLRPAIIAIIGSASSTASPAGRLPSDVGELGEQRPVGIERALRPHAAGDRRDLGEHGVEPGEVVHVHFEDAGQLGQLDAHRRVDVRLARAVGGRRGRRTAGRRPSSAGPGRRAPWRTRRTSARWRRGCRRTGRHR